MSVQFDNRSLVDLVLRRKKPLFIILIIAFVCSWLTCQFIPPKYKSTAVVYPSNLIPYSSETPTEQMLQIFQSEDIREWVVATYDLYNHYGVDSTKEKYHKSILVNEYENNVSFSKTPFESVVITVLDENPEMASDIVKSIIEFFNRKVQLLYRDKAKEVVLIRGNEATKKQEEINRLEKELKGLRTDHGILDYKLQSKELVKKEMQLMSEGGTGSERKKVEALAQQLKQKGDEAVALEQNLKAERKLYNELKKGHEAALRDLEKELSFTNYVTHPYPSDKKASPITWLIVLASCCSSLVVAILGFGLWEKGLSKDKSDRHISNDPPKVISSISAHA